MARRCTETWNSMAFLPVLRLYLSEMWLLGLGTRASSSEMLINSSPFLSLYPPTLSFYSWISVLPPFTISSLPFQTDPYLLWTSSTIHSTATLTTTTRPMPWRTPSLAWPSTTVTMGSSWRMAWVQWKVRQLLGSFSQLTQTMQFIVYNSGRGCWPCPCVKSLTKEWTEWSPNFIQIKFIIQQSNIQNQTHNMDDWQIFTVIWSTQHSARHLGPECTSVLCYAE